MIRLDCGAGLDNRSVGLQTLWVGKSLALIHHGDSLLLQSAWTPTGRTPSTPLRQRTRSLVISVIPQCRTWWSTLWNLCLPACTQPVETFHTQCSHES